MYYKIGFWILCIIIITGVVVFNDKLYRQFIKIVIMFEPQLNEKIYAGKNLTVYLGQTDSLPWTYSKHVKNIDDFNIWKNGDVIKEYKQRPKHNNFSNVATMISMKVYDNYTLEKFTMPSSYTTNVFYKMTPKYSLNKTVLIIPSSGNTGASDVLGERSSSFIIESSYYQGNIGRQLVNNGYTVFVTELYGYGERGVSFDDYCKTDYTLHGVHRCGTNILNAYMTIYGIEPFSIWLDEISQVISQIEDHRIAVVGLSLGSELATRQAVINHDIIDVVVSASGANSIYHSNKFDVIIGSMWFRDQFKCCDTNDHVATLAPTPLYVSFGKLESYGKDDGGIYGYEVRTNHTGTFLKEVYELNNAGENFTYVLHDGGHEYHIPSILEFLYTHL